MNEKTNGYVVDLNDPNVSFSGGDDTTSVEEPFQNNFNTLLKFMRGQVSKPFSIVLSVIASYFSLFNLNANEPNMAHVNLNHGNYISAPHLGVLVDPNTLKILESNNPSTEDPSADKKIPSCNCLEVYNLFAKKNSVTIGGSYYHQDQDGRKRPIRLNPSESINLEKLVRINYPGIVDGSLEVKVVEAVGYDVDTLYNIMRVSSDPNAYLDLYVSVLAKDSESNKPLCKEGIRIIFQGDSINYQPENVPHVETVLEEHKKNIDEKQEPVIINYIYNLNINNSGVPAGNNVISSNGDDSNNKGPKADNGQKQLVIGVGVDKYYFTTTLRDLALLTRLEYPIIGNQTKTNVSLSLNATAPSSNEISGSVVQYTLSNDPSLECRNLIEGILSTYSFSSDLLLNLGSNLTNGNFELGIGPYVRYNIIHNKGKNHFQVGTEIDTKHPSGPIRNFSPEETFTDDFWTYGASGRVSMNLKDNKLYLSAQVNVPFSHTLGKKTLDPHGLFNYQFIDQYSPNVNFSLILRLDPSSRNSNSTYDNNIVNNNQENNNGGSK